MDRKSIVFQNCFVLIALLTFCIGVNCVSYAQERTEVTAYIPHIPDIASPVIDGILDDDAWIYATQGNGQNNESDWYVRINPDFDVDDPVQTGSIDGQNNGDRPEDDADASFRVWTLYDDEYLYVAVATQDWDYVNHLPPDSVNEATWYEDAVEIFVDGDFSRTPGSVNSFPDPSAEYATGGQFVVTSAGAIRHAEAGNPVFGDTPEADWFASVFDNDNVDGSNYEFRIKLSKIGNPTFGSKIGFNVAMNDADDSGSSSADYQILWTGASHQEDTYGALEFGRRSITAPLITDAVEIDGKMDESIWASAATGKGGMPYGPFTGSTVPKDLADLSFDFWVMHDIDYLYVAVDVKDDEVIADSTDPETENGSTWYDDSVEIFIDGNHTHTSGRVGQNGFHFGGQLVITTNQSWRDTEASEVEVVFYGPEDDRDWYALTSLTETGYIAEYRVKKSSLFDSADRELIGFEIAINEDDSEPPNEKDSGQQVTWNGHVHNEASYGDLILGGPSTDVLYWEIY